MNWISTAVNARLWDHFAISFYNALKAATEHPVITILSCCQLKRNEYNGVCHVRNVAATEFHLNANVSYVQNLRKRSFFVTKTISTVSTIHRPNCYYVLQIFRCEWVMKCNLRFNIEHSFPVYYPPVFCICTQYVMNFVRSLALYASLLLFFHQLWFQNFFYHTMSHGRQLFSS